MVKAIRAEHELHGRRYSRNLGVGLTLVGLVVLILLLTMVKVRTAGPILGYETGAGPAPVEATQ